jgi:hypothetical protein
MGLVESLKEMVIAALVFIASELDKRTEHFPEARGSAKDFLQERANCRISS